MQPIDTFGQHQALPSSRCAEFVRRGRLLVFSLAVSGCNDDRAEELAPADTTTGGTSAETESDSTLLEQLDDCVEAAEEPLIQLPRIADGAVAYFAASSEQPPLGEAAHRCPTGNDAPRTGAAVGPVVPILGLDCGSVPDGTCTPIPDASQGGAGRYLIENWGTPPFAELGFSMTQPHRFHYQFNANNAASGFGACRFTAMAFGNLDEDVELLSTYRIIGELSEDGADIGPVEWAYPCR